MPDAAVAQRTAARTAGIAILLVLLAGIFSQVFVFMRLPTNEAAGTARNILTHETLFRCGIVSAFVSSVAGIVEIWALFVLFKPFRGNLALLALLLSFTGSILFLNTMPADFLVLHLLHAESFLAPFTASQLHAAAQLLLAHDDGLRTSLIFSSLGAMLFAWLFLQSRYIPRAISGFWFFANIFTAASCFSLAIAPDTVRVVFPWFPLVNCLAMLSLALWLTLKGAAIRARNSD